MGSIVEARWTEPGDGRESRLVVAVRSDLEHQIEAEGATWLDRQLVGRTPARLAERGFGQEVRDALDRRTERLIERGWAERTPEGVRFQPGMLTKLRDRELEATGRKLTKETGLIHQSLPKGETVAGEVRRKLTLASGRFAMIDDGWGSSSSPGATTSAARSTATSQASPSLAAEWTGTSDASEGWDCRQGIGTDKDRCKAHTNMPG